jgi:hypothetical protein
MGPAGKDKNGVCHLPSAMHHADCGGHLKSHPSFVYVVACGRNVHEDGSVEGPDGVGVVEDRAGQAGEAMAGCLLWLSESAAVGGCYVCKSTYMTAARATKTSDEYLRAILSKWVVRVV